MAGSAVNGASVLGINFNNNDGAGAQEGSSTFGATWTDVNSASGTAGSANGSSSNVTFDWNSQEFYQGGSWTGTDGFNSAIGTMRVYLDDGDGLGGSAPVDMGATGSDGIGVSVRLSGLSAWLASEGASAYRITLYHSTDTGSATFRDFSLRDGSTVSSSILETITPTVGGNGSWDGTSEDPSGNSTVGTRGITEFTGSYDQDVLTITGLSRSGSSRGGLSAIVIEAIPEPSTAMLSFIGGLGILLRRRR